MLLEKEGPQLSRHEERREGSIGEAVTSGLGLEVIGEVIQFWAESNGDRNEGPDCIEEAMEWEGTEQEDGLSMTS